MHNDNIYPNFGEPFNVAVPAEQVAKQNKRLEDVLDQVPLLKEVVTRLDKRIADTDSVRQALDVAKEYQIDRETALIVLDLVRKQLEPEKEYIALRIKQAKR